MNLSGWTIEEMAIDTSVGMLVRWPSLDTSVLDRATFTRRNRPFKEVKKRI